MLQEAFAIGNTWVHRLDPRVRIVSAGMFSVVVAISRSFQGLALALGFAAALVVMARLPARQIGKRIAVVNGFVALLWLALPLTFDGPTAVTLGPLRLTTAGIVMAGQITLKSNAILLTLIALVATMNFSTLGCALNGLRVPDKIVHLLLMTYRYVFLIEQEYRRLIRSAQIRGFQPKTDGHTYRTYAAIMGILLVRSAERAERVYQAMLCRGFKRKFYCLHEFRTGKTDWLFALATGGVTLALIGLEWLGSGFFI